MLARPAGALDGKWTATLPKTVGVADREKSPFVQDGWRDEISRAGVVNIDSEEETRP